MNINLKNIIEVHEEKTVEKIRRIILYFTSIENFAETIINFRLKPDISVEKIYPSEINRYADFFNDIAKPYERIYRGRRIYSYGIRLDVNGRFNENLFNKKNIIIKDYGDSVNIWLSFKSNIIKRYRVILGPIPHGYRGYYTAIREKSMGIETRKWHIRKMGKFTSILSRSKEDGSINENIFIEYSKKNMNIPVVIHGEISSKNLPIKVSIDKNIRIRRKNLLIYYLNDIKI